MGISRQQVNLWLANAARIREGKDAPPAKRRKPWGQGPRGEQKQWLAEQSRKPGHFLLIKTVSEANRRDKWDAIRRAKMQREAAYLFFTASFRANPPTPPVVVTMKRFGVGTRLLDDDNLRRALKAVRDGIADALGVDDGSLSQVRWEYQQEKGKHYGIHVTITPMQESPTCSI
jgi:hypothetical protein